MIVFVLCCGSVVGANIWWTMADYERQDHHRRTGTNEHGLAGTPTCDADLVKFSQNIDITSNLFKTSQKKVILATLLSTLFSSNNVITIDSKKLFFLTKTQSITQYSVSGVFLSFVKKKKISSLL
jgi:hypothetical protein